MATSGFALALQIIGKTATVGLSSGANLTAEWVFGERGSGLLVGHTENQVTGERSITHVAISEIIAVSRVVTEE